MGDERLMTMAREIAARLRANLTIDWPYKDNMRARLRTVIKALLERYKYLPDQEARAIEVKDIQGARLRHLSWQADHAVPAPGGASIGWPGKMFP
jgi:hypothetical protein